MEPPAFTPPDFPLFQELLAALPTLGITLEWRYYRDAKGWLGKATRKKKTIVWIGSRVSDCDLAFHFNAKTAPRIATLPLTPTRIAEFEQTPFKGKHKRLLIILDTPEALRDALTLMSPP